MARRLILRPGVGEHLLTTKLLILNGTHRASNSALRMLTGSLAVQRLAVADLLDIELLVDPIGVHAEPVARLGEPGALSLPRNRHFSARTIYLSEHHLDDVDRIADAWQSLEPRRLSRSAVVRRAVEFLNAAVKADPAKPMLETE